MEHPSFRVWCFHHQEWERDRCALTASGEILHNMKGIWMPLRLGMHIAEQYVVELDCKDVPMYVGDIVEYEFMICGLDFWEVPRSFDRMIDVGEGSKYYFRNVTGYIIRDGAEFIIEKIGPKCEEDFYDHGINFSWKKCLVIGNIHENPELLNKL